MQPGDSEIEVDSINGNPLDWVVQMHQLKAEDFPEGLTDSKTLAKAVYDRTGFNDYTSVSANFWSLKIALVSNVCNYLFGLAQPDLGLTLSEDEDAVYILRSYSGTLVDTSPDKIDTDIIKSLKAKDGELLGMNRYEFRALTSNLIQGTLDFT